MVLSHMQMISSDFHGVDYSTKFETSVGVECLEDSKYKHPEGSFVLSNLEVWSAKITKSTSAEGLSKSDEKLRPCPNMHPWHNYLYPYGMFRVNPVYNVPAGVKVDQLALGILGKKSKLKAAYNKKELNDAIDLGGLYADMIETAPRENGVMDVDYDIQEVTDESQAKDIGEGEDFNNIGYLPKMGVFEHFEEQGGVKELISVTHRSLKLWKNMEAAAKWELWLQELESFSSIPLFFRFFIKNKKCKDLLFF